MIDLELAADLDQLAAAIARMRPPQSHNPDAFHEDRSELAARARRLAERARFGLPPAPADVPAPAGRQVERRREVIHANGRTILVLTKRSAAAVSPA